MIIHLGWPLPDSSSGLPGNAAPRSLSGIERAAQNAFPYLALHREEFTWPHLLPDTPVSSYRTISPIAPPKRVAGIFSVALVVIPMYRDARTLSGSLPLWCSDFPLSLVAKAITQRLSIARQA